MNRLSHVAVAALVTLSTCGAAAVAAPAALAAGARIAVVPSESHPNGDTPSGDDGSQMRKERKVVVLSDGGPRHEVVLKALSGAYLGVELTELTPELRTHFGVPDDRGVMIGRVEKDSPAAAAGLTVGDIVTAIDGEPVDSTWDLSVAVRRHEDGDSVDLSVWRDGRALDVTATLTEREREQIDLGSLPPLEGLEGLQKLREMHWVQSDDLDGEDGKETRIIVRPEIVRELGESLDTVDWPALDGRLRARNRELEERLEHLEKKLQELEKRLDQTVPQR